VNELEVAEPAAEVLASGGAQTDDLRGGVQANGLIGCNNGCCDPHWLANDLCAQSGDWLWFLFNYGWSYAHSGGRAYLAQAHACAAVGWSHFFFNVGGSVSAWWVPEGHFQYASWSGIGTWSYTRRTIISSVNTEAAQNLHTNCGKVLY
jgi:hypothetical protein